MLAERVALHAHYEAKQKQVADKIEAARRQRLGFGADAAASVAAAAAAAAAEAEVQVTDEAEAARRERGAEGRELHRRLLVEEARQRLAERGR